MTDISEVEIDSNKAREMVRRGSKLIWILGPIDDAGHTVLRNISENVYSIHFEMISKAKDPKALVGDSPVLVCKHGVTSLFLANRLRNQGVRAYSLNGGMQELGRI